MVAFKFFSLTGIRKLSENGCEFRSHVDGSKHLFTPESVMDIERTIGADIMMAFDECPPGTADFGYARQSLDLTHRWLDRCIKRFSETEDKYGHHQATFPPSFKVVFTQNCAAKVHSLWQNVTQKVMPSVDLL